MRSLLSILAILAFTLGAAGSARAWEPLRAANGHVERGNRRMAEEDPAGALEAYDAAARELPSEAGVHLNRGVALLASGDHARAREALLLATEPSAPAELRGAAYYDLGLSFYREGDRLALEEDHQGAQDQFREAADAFRRSLRAAPGNRDAAWNLELALRRIQEQQEQQE
ncbi:MAG: hypothetical protein OEY14_14110, partial [Myxococcales bacterium]|nr:hypothetical protein [Myxococcales bacterium]